jgi:hypothetical protein
MRALVIAALAVAGIVACGSDGPDELVGATCRDDLDCVDACLRGGDYPGGFCTVACRDDRDCPSDTICTDRNGSVCLYPCEIDRHCDFLGPYRCRDARDSFGRAVGVCLGG